VERLAPLRFQHINVQGTYHFTLPESVAQAIIVPFDNLPPRLKSFSKMPLREP